MTTQPISSVPVAPSATSWISTTFANWLDDNALYLDSHSSLASELLPKLAAEQLFTLGVPSSLGGRANTSFDDAVLAIAQVAQHSLTAAFVLWSQRSFIEYLLHTQHSALRERYLEPLLTGRIAGSTGLSNALKFLSGIEELQIHSELQPNGMWRLQGSLPWLTNLRPQNYVVAVPIANPNGKAAIAVVAASDRHQTRSSDIALVALQASNTASLAIDKLPINPATQLLDDNAADFIGRVRPQFLALQCGMSLGLSQRCLQQVLQHPSPIPILYDNACALEEQRLTLQRNLLEGVASGHFLTQVKDLFAVRIALADVVAQAAALESSNEGGVSFIAGARDQTQRRLREAQFIPIVTPTVAQLKGVVGS